MKLSVHKLFLILIAAVALPFAARADVNLVFSPSATSVAPGGMFNVTLSLQATAGEHVNGIDYFFQELSAAGFSIISRDVNGSPWSSTFFSDSQVTTTSDAAPPAGPDNRLNPQNDRDLGGNTPVANDFSGSGLVANFTLQAPMTSGTYTIMTTSVAGTGWNDPQDNEFEFDSQASVTINVVPEPATGSLVVLGTLGCLGLGLLRRNRRA